MTMDLEAHKRQKALTLCMFEMVSRQLENSTGLFFHLITLDTSSVGMDFEICCIKLSSGAFTAICRNIFGNLYETTTNFRGERKIRNNVDVRNKILF